MLLAITGALATPGVIDDPTSRVSAPRTAAGEAPHSATALAPLAVAVSAGDIDRTRVYDAEPAHDAQA